MRTPFSTTGILVLELLGIMSVSYTPYASGQECSQGCVTTYGYDYSRDNANPSESYFKASTLGTTLTPTATSSPDLNGVVYAQPLYISQVNVTGQSNPVNALFVATEENYVYALNGDSIGNSAYWSVLLNKSGETAVPDAQLPMQCNNISPEVGITGTPVIDTDNNVLYVVSKHYNTSSGVISQRLNVLNLLDGSAAAPALDIGNALGSGFSAVNENQRSGIALVSQGNTPGGPQVYVTWGSHCDASIGTPTYTGWVGAFHFTPGSPQGSLTFSGSFNDETGTGASKGGIWMSGGAPAVTSAPESSTIADVYLATGNGSFSVSGSNLQYGESVLRLHHGTDALSLSGFYTPNAWNILNNGSSTDCTSSLLNLAPPDSGTTACSPGDFDMGSGSVILARPVGSGFLPPTDSFVVLAAGKEGVFYDLDPLNMNNSGADTVDPCSTGTGGQTIQCFSAIHLPFGCCVLNGMKNRDYGSRGSNAFWSGNSTYTENVLYVAGSQDSEVRAYQMTVSGQGTFTTGTLFGTHITPDPDAGSLARYPGSSPVISWNSASGVNTDAILWILVTSANGSGRAKLYTYTALPGVGGTFTALWNDTANGPYATKFMVPTVINGHVYVGGQKPGATCSAGSCLGRVVAWH